MQQGFEQIDCLQFLDTDEFIGGMGLALERCFDGAEVYYWLGRFYWDLGLATEALSTVR